jgi:multidrug efflux pump subunit AcrB
VLLLSFVVVWYTPQALPSLTSVVNLMAVVIVAASAVAWWFLPACESVWSNTSRRSVNKIFSFRNDTSSKIMSWLIQRLGSNKLLLILLILIVLGIPWFMLPQKIDHTNSAATFYNNTIGSRWFSQEAKPFLERYLGGVLQPFHQLTFEKSGYRKSDKTLLVVQASLPMGHTPEQLNELLQDVEPYLLSESGIDQFVTVVNSAQSGRIDITFKQEAEAAGLPWKLRNDLIQMTLQRGGANWVVTGVGNAFDTNLGSGQSFFRWVITGPTYELVEQESQRIVEKLQKDRRVENIIGNAGVQGQARLTNEYILAFSEEQLSLQSTTLMQFAKAMQAASEMDYVGSLGAKKVNKIPIFVAPLFDRGGLPIFNVQNGSMEVNGKNVILKGTSNMKMVPSTPIVFRKNRAYCRVISFSYTGNRKAGDRFAQNTLNSLRPQFPVGCFIGPEEYTELSLPTAHLAWLGGILLLLCYGVCAMFFNNFRYAAIAMMGIPVSFIFGMALFSAGGFYFDQGGFAATLLLVGFSVYSALLFIDEFRELKKYYAISDHLLLKKCIITTRKKILLPNVILMCSVIPVLWKETDAPFWFSYSVGLAGGITGIVVAIWVVLPAFLWNPLPVAKSIEKSANIN